MTTTTAAQVTPGLRTRRLPRWAPAAVAAGAVLVGIGLGNLLGNGPPMMGILAVLLFIIGLGVASTVVEGSRSARNRIATTLVYSAFALALAPLLSVIWTLLSKGTDRLNGSFLQHSMRNVSAFDNAGGAYHAIIGTLEQAGIATLITVPLGILGAIYIVEYGRGLLATLIRFFVDVMTGIPSIVAGLFILAFWVLVITPLYNNGRPEYSGFAAALALAVLMLPTVVRSTEEMLRLVPGPAARGRVRTRHRQVEDHPPDRTSDRAARHRHRRHALGRPRRRRDRTGAAGRAAATTRSTSTRSTADQQSLSLYIYQQAGTASKYAPRPRLDRRPDPRRPRPCSSPSPRNCSPGATSWPVKECHQWPSASKP